MEKILPTLTALALLAFGLLLAYFALRLTFEQVLAFWLAFFLPAYGWTIMYEETPP